MTVRTVLIPLDGSRSSRQIVRVVRTFINPEGVKLILFRAANPPAAPLEVNPNDRISSAMPVAGSYESYSRAVDVEFTAAAAQREEYRRRIDEELREEVEHLRSVGYSVSAEVQFGEAGQRIIDYVNEKNVDLVAMTTHGRTGFGKLVLGSVAERVVRGVFVPVLLMRSVPEAEERTAPDEMLSRTLGDGVRLRIAAATDCSTLAQRAVGRAAELAQALNAEFKLLVVASEDDSAEHSQQMMEEAIQQVATLEPRPEAVPLVGYADEVLLQYLAKNPVDILCIGAFHDRGAGSTTAIGPTAQRVVQYASTSVLMCKGHRSHFRRILACLAVDDTEIVDVAAHLARAISADLSLLHVIPPSAASYLSPANSDESGAPASISLSQVLSQGTRLSSLLTSWISQLEEHGIGEEAMLVQQGSVPEAILKTAHDGWYDLIIVGSHSSPGHFLGSVANGVVRYAEQSVLLLRTGGQ
jgi:nucleotide-binding universal stress UspA family protein